jgi:FAD/FMN-containing dehydrogenase
MPKGFQSAYFSQQQRELTPECVVFPTSSEDVSHILQIVKPHDCHFAVKSGGHGIFAGASNTNGGVTVDLRELNSLRVSEDRLTTSIGTGRKWGEVYRELEPMNLVVTGGRDTQIGVGGFILGDE